MGPFFDRVFYRTCSDKTFHGNLKEFGAATSLVGREKDEYIYM